MAAAGGKWYPPLPPGWEARWDPNQRAFFYIDHHNKVTSWDDPRWPKNQLATPMAGGQQSQGEGIPMKEINSRASPKPSHHQGHASGRQTPTSQHAFHPKQETSFTHHDSNIDALVASVQSKFRGSIQESLIKDILASCNNNLDAAVAQLVDLGFTKESTTPKRNSHANQASHGSGSHLQRPRSSSGHSTDRKSPHRATASGTATPQRSSPAKKQLSDSEKQSRKIKLCAEFKDLEEQVVQMALEANQYSEEKARATLARVASKWLTTSSSETSRPSTATSDRSAAQRPVSPANLSQPATMEPVAFSITAEERLETNNDSRPSSRGKKTSAGSAVSAGQRSAHRTGQQSHHHRAKQVTKMSEQLLTTTNDLLNHLATTSPCCPEERHSPQPSPHTSPPHSPTPDRPGQVVTSQPQPKSKVTTHRPQPKPHGGTRQAAPKPSGRVGGAGLAQGPDPALLIGSNRLLRTGPDHSLFTGGSVGADGPNPEYHSGQNSDLHQGHNPDYHQGSSSLATGSGGAMGSNPALRCSTEHNIHRPLEAAFGFLQSAI